MLESLCTAQSASSKKKRFQPVVIVVGGLALIVISWALTTFLRDALALGRVDSALVSVRALVAAEAKFAQTHPDLGYTCGLSQLPVEDWMKGLTKDGSKNGYAFTISGCRPANGKGPNVSYYVTARPLRSDMPAFCSDQSGIVKSDEGGSVESCLHSGVP